MNRLSRREFIAASSFLAGSPAIPQVPGRMLPARNLLAGACSGEKLATLLLPREKWHPFPTAAERGAWEALPPADRGILVEAGVRGLGREWPGLPATLFLEYARIGNRSNYEAVRDKRRARLRELVIAECVEGKGQFVDEIVDGIWTTCEETYWGVPAHLGLQKAGSGLPDVSEPTVDLFSAETSSLLAWTLYLLGPQLDAVSPLLRERIHYEIDRRVLTPNLARDFYWMGFPETPSKPVRPPNNWNPWINSNWLTSTLLMERDEKRRTASVYRILLSLDNFLNGYHDDGGCDEGPSYWFRAGGSLFDCLELLLSATNGNLNFYDVPLVREIGRYIYRVHIHDRYFINFADASAVLKIAGDLLFRYGRRIEDEKLSGLGAFAVRENGNAARSDSIGRQLPALFNLSTIRAAQGRQPLVRDAWFPGIQVMAARQREGSADGLYLAAQGGHNGESHNHNDVGNFVVYADGLPVIIDIGVETYSAKTFSAARYDIWTMQSAYHNLPTIDGVMQKAGSEFAADDVAYHSDDLAALFSLNIAPAYPSSAGLQTWTRTLRLDRRANQIELTDHYILNRHVAEITWTFMTPCEAKPVGPGEIVFAGRTFQSGNVRLAYDARLLVPKIEEIPLKDARLRGVWGERLFRILLQVRHPAAERDWRFRIVQR